MFRYPSCDSDEAIESDPLPPGQVWAVSPGSDVGAGLFRIEVTSGPGSGVKILNQPTSPPFRESVRVGELVLHGLERYERPLPQISEYDGLLGVVSAAPEVGR